MVYFAGLSLAIHGQNELISANQKCIFYDIFRGTAEGELGRTDRDFSPNNYQKPFPFSTFPSTSTEYLSKTFADT